MIINKKKNVEVDAKILKIHLKVRDCFTAVLVDADGEELKEYEGYVPAFMPGEHYGDYVELDIDIDTGQITNWVKPGALEIQGFIDGEHE